MVSTLYICHCRTLLFWAPTRSHMLFLSTNKNPYTSNFNSEVTGTPIYQEWKSLQQILIVSIGNLEMESLYNKQVLCLPWESSSHNIHILEDGHSSCIPDLLAHSPCVAGSALHWCIGVFVACTVTPHGDSFSRFTYLSWLCSTAWEPIIHNQHRYLLRISPYCTENLHLKTEWPSHATSNHMLSKYKDKKKLLQEKYSRES